MNRKFSDTKAIAAIKKYETGTPVREICKEFGISYATFYNWKSRIGGFNIDEIGKLLQLEKENLELKKMFAELGLENRALKNMLEKRSDN